jgi:drug/metabolite transporter (DMT)-like permease
MNSALRKKGLLNVHLAGLLFGGTSLFSKAVALPALDMTAIRSLIAVLVLFAVLYWRKQSIKLTSSKHAMLMVVTGVLLGLHWVTYFHAMQVSSIAVGMIALFTYPMITIFLEPLMKGAKPHKADIICGFVVLFGVFLMVPSFSLESKTTLGVLWGVFSAFLFSLRNVIQRHYLAEYTGDVSILYQGTVVVLMLMLFVKDVPSFDNSYIWLQLLVLGAVFTALPHTLFASGLRFLNAKTVSFVSCLQPVYATFFAFLILKEQPAMTTLIGGTIVVMVAAWETSRS